MNSKWIKDNIVMLRDVLALFTFALAVFYVESVAWPIHPGRDMRTYLAYYTEFFDKAPVNHFGMTFLTPVAPFFIGWSNAIGGPIFLEFVQGILFAAAIIFAYLIGCGWGRRLALFLGIALGLYPPFSLLFHQVFKRLLFCFRFCRVVLVGVKGVDEPNAKKVRILRCRRLYSCDDKTVKSDVNAVLRYSLFLSSLRFYRRVALSGAFLGTCVLLVLAWSFHNYLRYDSFAFSRGANACMPLYRLWTVSKVVHPDNGPASRDLAAVVSRDLLNREPYISCGISEELYFKNGSSRTWSDLVALSDRTWGWHDNYRHLRRVAIEALRQHMALYVRELILDCYDIMVRSCPVPSSIVKHTFAGEKRMKDANVIEKESSVQSGGQLIPHAFCPPVLSNPNNSLVSSEEQLRFQGRIDALALNIPRRDGSVFIAARLHELTAVWPPMLAFIFLGFLGTILVPSRQLYFLAALTGMSMTVVFVTVAGMAPYVQYRTHFDAMFIIFGILGTKQLGSFFDNRKA